METTIQPRLLAVNDAATYLGVSRSSLLRALDNGDIPRVRIAGRVLVDRGWGWPLTNERPTAEGGRVQDFEQRTATWHPSGVVTSEQKDVQ